MLAHILVCFLAYVLWKTLEQWQSRAGLGNSPRILLQELAAITSTDVILPTAVLPAANCDCAASCAPIAPKRSCWSASVSDSQQLRIPRGAHNVVPTLGVKCLKSLARATETAEVALGGCAGASQKSIAESSEQAERPRF